MNAIDLFCGGGGASEGLRQAGIEVVLAVDLDKAALTTHQANHPDTEHLQADVTALLRDDYSWPEADFLWASPPCQQFSYANSAKGDPEIGMVLVDAALDVVERVKPRAGWCMENVPPVLEHLPMHRIPAAKVLNAADYGVPQRRRRCYYGRYTVPIPTHQARGHGQQQTIFGGAALQPWVTVREALGPLLLEPHPEAVWTEPQLKRIVAGKRDPSSLYHGSWATAGKMEFPDSLDKPARTILATAASPGREAFVIPGIGDLRGSSYQPRTWDPDQPAPTVVSPHHDRLTTEVGGQLYRRLTTLEASLLQGFPPTYRWLGTKTAQYRQIGNACCPPMVRAIGEALR